MTYTKTLTDGTEASATISTKGQVTVIAGCATFSDYTRVGPDRLCGHIDCEMESPSDEILTEVEAWIDELIAAWLTE